MFTGPNFQPTTNLAKATDVPVIARGGVDSIEHIKTLKTLPVWGVIVGQSLYEGKVNLAEAVALTKLEEQNLKAWNQ